MTLKAQKTTQNNYNFSPTILREYDIRGQIDKDLSEEDAYYLGRAFGTFVRRKGGSTACVGYDGRETSPALAKALTCGLNESGIDVTSIGLGPSPMLYYAVKSRKSDAGIMVTGSHNPPDYNGFKMILLNEGVYGQTIQDLGRIAASGDFENGAGQVEQLDIREAYTARLLADSKGNRPLKVAWDNGNGAGGEILRMLTDQMPGEHFLLYDEIDGNFPNHHPDPTVDENLIDLQALVKEKGCDIGIAFDGDGDRIGVVDENGQILRCDMLMTIYASEILKRLPGSAIIGDIKCSALMFEEIERMGGNAVMWKTGHSLVKAKMAELNAPLAGELSGHIFFADDYYGYDDALYCAVRLLNIVRNINGAFSDLTKNLPKLHSTAEIRFEVDESEKFNLLPRVIESIKSQNLSGIEINDIDGIRVTTSDGWWLLRASNTQSVLVARAEGKSADGLKRLKNMLSTEVQKLGYKM